MIGVRIPSSEHSKIEYRLGVAQLAVRLPLEQEVGGSNPPSQAWSVEGVALPLTTMTVSRA